MPELPDVHVFKQYFDATSLHLAIEGIRVRTPDLLENTSPQGLGRKLNGRPFEATATHGKYLFAELDQGGALVLHFGMTGYLKKFEGPEDAPDHLALRIDFADGSHLGYVCIRKLGLIGFTDDPSGYAADKELGPDALDIGLDVFRDRLSGRKGMIKSALMNQSILSGIGNVYSDEVLFQAGIHPKTEVNALDKDDLAELHRTMRRVLKTTIRHQADPGQFPDSYLTPKREEGADCPNCRGSIASLKVSGRTSYFCPSCQKKES